MATAPLPPARFSTTIDWPISFSVRAASLRIMMSIGEPAADQQTKLIGFSG